MAGEPSKLRVSELDFSEIKNNFKEFLKSQDEFRDYNFEGSVISTLLDLLSYNTHYNSYYLNMIANEMFIDSAVTRTSVVSLAKMLGYTPRSRIGARANVNITITPNDNPSNIILSKNTKFNTQINGVNFVFVTDKSYTAAANNSNLAVTIRNVTLVEGEPLSYRYTVDLANDNQKFIIPNRGVDHSTISVVVQESDTDVRKSSYQQATDLIDVSSTSNVYFVEETSDFRTELTFGDGIIGNKLKNRNIVIVNYNLCSGVLANRANNFTVATTAGGYGTVTVTTNQSATGGSDEETLNSIRFNAPKNYGTQNRAVTKNDYQRLIQRDYPYAESVVVYGGEEADPPQFGKVFIGIKPREGLFLSSSIKETIANNIIKKYNVASVTPEFVDIDYINLGISSRIKYDSRLTSKTTQILRRNVLDAILRYKNQNLNQFEQTFRISQLQRFIDESEGSILGNDTEIEIKKQLTPNLTVQLDYLINFNNELYHPYSNFIGTLTSTVFTYQDDFDVIRTDCRFDDDDGVIRIYRISDGQKIILNANAGTIDYQTGRVLILSFKPESYRGNTLDLIVKPLNKDFLAKNEQILLINEGDINLTLYDSATTVSKIEV